MRRLRGRVTSGVLPQEARGGGAMAATLRKPRSRCTLFAGSKTFDYVIIDAGSAGCTLAGHLSEGHGRRILVQKAGGWDRDL
jgi:hypothetical protein